MIEFKYTDNSEAVDKALGNFQAALADQVPALQAIADDFRAMLAEQFASEGRAEGTPWPPRARRGGPRSRPGQAQGLPLLVRTGALRDSLVEAEAPGHVEEFDATSLTLGTRVPYAMFHQFGTRYMPARPIIVLGGERSERWVEMVRRAVEGKTVLLGAKEMGGTTL
ncbi:MAG: phage virion morphogenesis protein [Acidobacteriia bacterium]|nr:phage virion morphogenesis protein [Terriglobia bacterium]